MKLLNSGTGAFTNRNIQIPTGVECTFVMEGAGASDVVEIRHDPDFVNAGTPFAITDSTDSIDATKKVINQANNVRTIQGPLDVSIHRTGGSTDIKLWFKIR